MTGNRTNPRGELIPAGGLVLESSAPGSACCWAGMVVAGPMKDSTVGIHMGNSRGSPREGINRGGLCSINVLW